MSQPNELSTREIEILSLVVKGASNKEIAHDLHISTNTVKVHLRNIFTKIDANSRTEAAMYAVNAGLIDSGGNGKSESPATEQVRSNKNLFIGLGVAGILILLGVYAILTVSGAFYGNQNNSNQLSVPNEQRWQERAPLSAARKGLALVSYGGEIFAIAGESEQEVIGIVERYNPNIDQWTKMQSKPIPVTNISAAAIGGKIYVPGGRLDSGEVTNELEIYSPMEDNWEKGADIPIGLSAYALVSYEGQLYLFGGWDGKKVVNSVFRYDPDSDRWQALTPMPTARSFPGVGIIEGKLLVIGGFDGEKPLTTNEIYIPELERSENSPWETGENLPNPRYAMGVSSLVDTLHVFGGVGEEADPLPSLEYSNRLESWEIYKSPFDGQWSQLGMVPVGTNLYLVGGDINGLPTGTNLTYQAIYTINFPIVR